MGDRVSVHFDSSSDRRSEVRAGGRSNARLRALGVWRLGARAGSAHVGAGAAVGTVVAGGLSPPLVDHPRWADRSATASAGIPLKMANGTGAFGGSLPSA